LKIQANILKTKPFKKRMGSMNKWVCNVCGWVYDPQIGDPSGDIAPGTDFKDIPDGWICPECGAGKDDFSPQQ
jgi:rubredoxin